MDLISEVNRQRIVFELNARLPGSSNWRSELRAKNTVIAFINVDNDGTNEREYTWAIEELKLAWGVGEVVQIIADKEQKQLNKMTKAQQTMKQILNFK